MANAGAARSKSALRRWALAIVISLCANSLVASFFWDLRLTPVDDAAPVTVVEFVPRQPLQRSSSQTPRHPSARSGPLAVRRSFAPIPTRSAPTPVISPVPTAAPPGGDDVANLSRALKGRLGCELAHLTDAERAACTARWAANRPTTPTPLNLDPHLRYASDPEPYLTRMPKNGCKVRAAGDAGPMGQQGVAAGVSCGWSF